MLGSSQLKSLYVVWVRKLQNKIYLLSKKTTYTYSVIFTNHSCKILQQVPKCVYLSS